MVRYVANGNGMRRVIFILFCIAAVCIWNTPNAFASYNEEVDSDNNTDLDLLKPKIEYVNIDSIKYDDSGYGYNVNYTIKWRGSKYMSVGVGMYTGDEITISYPMLHSDYGKYEIIEDGIPYYMVSKESGTIYSEFYSEICFWVSNSYGMEEYIIYFDKGGVLASNDMIEDDLMDISGDGEDLFQVFDCSGRLIGECSNREEIREIAPKGLLIIRHIRGSEVVATEKLLNK